MKPSLNPAQRCTVSVLSTVLRAALLLALLHSPRVYCQLDSDKFTAISSCLGRPSTTSSCITCAVTVRVLEGGSDCSNSDGSLNNRNCSQLDDVIQSIAVGQTTHDPMDCIRILISPKADGQPYVVLARGERVLAWSVVFTGLVLKVRV